MPAPFKRDWRTDFGLDTREPPSLYITNSDILPSTPQSHLLARAFVDLEVDGILCIDHTPLVYFKLVDNLAFDAVSDLHRRFWNHGGAPVLVLISDDNVHIYSGMARPVGATEERPPSLVTELARVATGLREFLTALEVGEFFHQHQRSFNPSQRVDRALLQNLTSARRRLQALANADTHRDVLDGLICRLVFTCYLFDRGVIGKSYLESAGLTGVNHLRGLLALSDRTAVREALYRLFEQLRNDFNGDLFSDDLAKEKQLIGAEHLSILKDFFQGTDIDTGQATFWPYDFKLIPIETISAIYEQFLSDADEQKGAFYTPRFLAEIVLDTAVEGFGSLLGRRFLDPACGSGIFLVALFNRIAAEWRRANPDAKNDRTATQLMKLLRESLFGIDVSPIACRIAAFSLYLAYLDQLSPRDIQALQKKGKALPRLVAASSNETGNISCRDFFDEASAPVPRADLVIGNPPWGSIATKDSVAARWCGTNSRLLPDNQIAVAFAWKAPEHVEAGGRVCLVLPHGLLFNTKAVPFQASWLRTYAVDRVLNLADMRWYLFETAVHASVVIRYRPEKPGRKQRIEYWCPKTDWTVTQAEIITIGPQDRSTILVDELLRDLDGPDAPQLWNRQFWATGRDSRLLDRLSDLPRLRDVIRQSRDRSEDKRWLIAEGFQPVGQNDDATDAKSIDLPSRKFVSAKNKNIDLFLLERDTQPLLSQRIDVRGRSNKNTMIFKAPHVLVAKGFTKIAFADFDVSFRHALRGIAGPKKDRDLLAFLAAYLRSDLAKYYQFHTSNWGGARPEVHVDELLRLPFTLPEDSSQPKRASQIVREVAQIIQGAAASANHALADRSGIVEEANPKIEALVQEYFDIDPLEEKLIEDTISITIGSIQPKRTRMDVPTLRPSSPTELTNYLTQVCDMLNAWSAKSNYLVRGQVQGSHNIGVGVAMLEKVRKQPGMVPPAKLLPDVLHVLNDIRTAFPQRGATLDIVRGLMAFDGNRLYIAKPIGRRFWSTTAAMNDADEIATTILMKAAKNET
ncbi:MAG: N-6 DNA methylase [Hyphomicrobiaceae bacterium]